MTETEVPASDLRAGDVIPNHCGILVGVRVVEASGGGVLVARPDGSRFRTSIPDARILVRSPRPRLIEAMAS